MKKKKLETATDVLEFVELRAERDSEGKPAKLVGYAAVFNRDSRPVRTKEGRVFVERILPGAFRDELGNPATEVRATILHDQNIILGRRSKGTVKVEEDDHGLRAEIVPPDTTAGRDAFVQVERGDLDRMSFGFSDMEARTERQKDGTYLRTISKIKGFKEITLADDRAIYPDTEIHVRMAEEAIEQIEKASTDGGTAESRALVQVEDQTLAWCCKCLTERTRDVASAMDAVMSSAERLKKSGAELTNDDNRAIDDAYNAARDLRRRIAPTLAALDSLGAANDEQPVETPAGEARAQRQGLAAAMVSVHDKRHIDVAALKRHIDAHNAKFQAA